MIYGPKDPFAAMALDEEKPKKGEVSMLEGMFGEQFASVFNMAFSLIGLGMIQSLALKAAPALTNALSGFDPQQKTVSLARSTPKQAIPAFTPKIGL